MNIEIKRKKIFSFSRSGIKRSGNKGIME